MRKCFNNYAEKILIFKMNIMLKIKFLVLLVIITLDYSCNSCKEGNNTDKSSQTEENTLQSTMKTKSVKNERFRFSFIIPEVWEAINLSDNGDGYYIKNPKSNMDIRIYGEEITTGSENLFNCSSKDEFILSNGEKAVLCKTADDELFIYTSRDKVRVVFYIQSNTGNLNDTLTSIAGSLRFF